MMKPHVYKRLGVTFAADVRIPLEHKKRWERVRKRDSDQLDREVRRMIHFLENPELLVEVREIRLDGVLQRGGFAARAIKRGEVVGHYSGALLPLDRAEDESDYLFELPSDLMRGKWGIDAAKVGNETRFINHARRGEDNLRPVAFMYRGKPYIIFFAKRDLKKGQQLFFNYGRDYWLAKGVKPR